MDPENKPITLLDLCDDVLNLIFSINVFADKLSLKATCRAVHSKIKLTEYFESSRFGKKTNDIAIRCYEIFLKSQKISVFRMYLPPNKARGSYLDYHPYVSYCKTNINKNVELDRDMSNILRNTYFDKEKNLWQTDMVWVETDIGKHVYCNRELCIDYEKSDYIISHYRYKGCTCEGFVCICRPVHCHTGSCTFLHVPLWEIEKHLQDSIFRGKKFSENTIHLINLECLLNLYDFHSNIIKYKNLLKGKIHKYCRTNNRFRSYNGNMVEIFNEKKWVVKLEEIILGTSEMISWNQRKQIIKQMELYKDLSKEYEEMCKPYIKY